MQLSKDEIEVGQALGLIPRHRNTPTAIIKGLFVTLICSGPKGPFKFPFQSNTICSVIAVSAAKEAARTLGHSFRCVHSITNPEATLQ